MLIAGISGCGREEGAPPLDRRQQILPVTDDERQPVVKGHPDRGLLDYRDVEDLVLPAFRMVTADRSTTLLDVTLWRAMADVATAYSWEPDWDVHLCVAVASVQEVKGSG